MLSTSRDATAAANAVSFSGDDGADFAEASPPTPRAIPCGLQYRVDGILADGVLFTPSEMEHKWALFFRGGRLLFVRSWQRQLLVAADAHLEDGYLAVTRIKGTILDPGEPPEFTIAAVDFLIRSHALDLAYPAPLLADPTADLQQAALWSFSVFGNRALYATHQPFSAAPPEQVLRTNSLFHIAIARGDLTAAQHELDRGVPIDLLARDGLNALQWALSTTSDDPLDWLLARGCPIDARSDQGSTALMNAVQADNLARVESLIDRGADPNASDARGFTSLHRAAEMGHARLVRLLLASGADPAAVAQGHTPMSLAEANGHVDITTMLT